MAKRRSSYGQRYARSVYRCTGCGGTVTAQFLPIGWTMHEAQEDDGIRRGLCVPCQKKPAPEPTNG